MTEGSIIGWRMCGSAYGCIRVQLLSDGDPPPFGGEDASDDITTKDPRPPSLPPYPRRSHTPQTHPRLPTARPNLQPALNGGFWTPFPAAHPSARNQSERTYLPSAPTQPSKGFRAARARCRTAPLPPPSPQRAVVTVQARCEQHTAERRAALPQHFTDFRVQLKSHILKTNRSTKKKGAAALAIFFEYPNLDKRLQGGAVCPLLVENGPVFDF